MRVNLNGTEIYYDVDGTGFCKTNGQFAEKPVILALHGEIGFDPGYLRHGLGPLCDHAQVVSVDLRGQERSGRPDFASCTLEQMADDMAALCGSLGICRAFVLGHSSGGFVAMHAALRHPSLVAGLILCGSSPAMRAVPEGEGDLAPKLGARADASEPAIAARVFGGKVTLESVTHSSTLSYHTISHQCSCTCRIRSSGRQPLSSHKSRRLRS